MKKILSFCAAMLVAVAVNAGTDFAAPGYSCVADDAVLTGGSSSNFFLKTDVDPHCVAWSDCPLSGNALATWTVEATRGCYVSVSLVLGPVISSNKHNFEVTIKDDKGNSKGMLTEGGENTASEQEKALTGTILLPLAGTYTVEVYNNRDWGKGTIKKVILTYAADAPSEIIAVSAVELNKTALTLDLEEVEQLTATVSPDNATDPSVTWESSDEAVATVSETGFVKAIAAGTANIKAKAGEKEAVCAVIVAAAAIPDVDFAEPYVLSAKKAHLEGAVWKKYEDEIYKLYGDGGSNSQYGTASWTIHVTKACAVTGKLMDLKGGALFELDVYDAEDKLLGTIAQPTRTKWWSGNVDMDSINTTLTFPAAGNYTLKLRNTLAWSSGKTSGVTLTIVPEPQVLYLKPGVWYWKDNDEKFAIYAWADGKDAIWSDFMTLAENETAIWTGTIPAGYTDVIFVRFGNASQTPSWEDNMWNKTFDLKIVEGKDMYTISGWGEGEGAPCPGDWSKYEYVVPAKFYIIGTNGWDLENAIRSDEDSYVLHLDAGYYEIKVLVDGTWATSKGYDDLTEVAAGLSKNQEYGNICFTLAEAGDVKITYTATVFKLEGNFQKQATAVDNAEVAVKAQKVIMNGQIFIIRGGEKFNAQGQIVR